MGWEQTERENGRRMWKGIEGEGKWNSGRRINGQW